jgi:predicted nuclease of predicted toxin-antitoxin system
VAAFYADENFAEGVVVRLRRLGHDVLTAHEAGRANQEIPDEEVLALAAELGRCVLTFDQRDFVRLHGRVHHSGIVVCTVDMDFERLATAIDATVRGCASLPGTLLRVNRPA